MTIFEIFAKIFYVSSYYCLKYELCYFKQRKTLEPKPEGFIYSVTAIDCEIAKTAFSSGEGGSRRLTDEESTIEFIL